MIERPFGGVEVCRECFCIDVQWEDWVEVKTNEPTGTGTGSDSIYCVACQIAGADCTSRYTASLPMGAPGTWEIPPREWFDSDDEHEAQILRLRAFGFEAARHHENAA